jgi:hypothetical protein
MTTITHINIHRTLQRSAAVLLFALGAACGSGVATGPPGSGGGLSSSSSGNTTSGSSTSGSSGSGGGGACVEGGACVTGDSCTDGSCCPCVYECVAGRWEMSACAGCAAPTCSGAIPSDGATCDECSTPPSCEYEDCAAGGRLQANCNGSEWSVSATACDPAPPCGPDASAGACPDGELCVAVTTNAGPSSSTTYSCEPNPCAPFPTSCACAQSLCTAAGAPLCVSADARSISCDDGNQ